MGINRPKLQELFHTAPAISPIPAIHSQVKESILSTYSPEVAQERFCEALREIGLSLEEFPPLHIIHAAKPPHAEIMTLIKEDWERLFGIHCILKSLKWDRHFVELSGNEFHVNSIGWEAMVNDPIYTLNVFVEGGRNHPNWINHQYRKIVRQAEEAVDEGTRRERYARAEELLLDEMPIAPVFSTSLFALKKRKMGTSCSLNQLDFKWCHLS